MLIRLQPLPNRLLRLVPIIFILNLVTMHEFLSLLPGPVTRILDPKARLDVGPIGDAQLGDRAFFHIRFRLGGGRKGRDGRYE